MTVLASTILTDAASVLMDPANVRWSAAELLVWLNQGQQELVVYKPNAYRKNTAHQLVTGTKQALPTDCLALIDVVRNLGTDGATPGKAVKMVQRDLMDAQNIDWHTATASAVVRHYMYSALDPKVFYVYPRQPATGCGQVEIVYGAAPTTLLNNSPLQVDDVYAPALLNYVLYRAYLKDTEANVDLAQLYYQAFLTLVGGKTTGETATDPNARA